MKQRIRITFTAVAAFGLTATLTAAVVDPLQKPHDNRFTLVALTQPNALAEPMSFEVLKDGRAFLIERRGAIKVYDPATQTVKPVGLLTVNNAVRSGNGEQGLVGMTLDPQFADNGWMYLYYQHPTEEKSVLSRWEIRDNVLVANSEKVVLDWPAQRDVCCHTGGGMTWDKDGNLFLTVGNNRGNNISAHTDERPGRASYDDQGGSANANSLEGKILRIHPEPDGTYTIPKGNLFPPGTAKTRPEIYTMGHRNAWRVSIDSQTGFIYWGEVGPDARQASERGPNSYDEFNQARRPGYFGWPYFVGEEAYPHWDYAANKPGEFKNPSKPLNTSPNNTGITELPPMEPAFIYYPYAVSEKFPALGSGQRSATGGPIYHRADFKEAKRPWPAYYEGKWIATDFSRRLIVLIAMNEQGDYQSMERFLPNYKPVEPIDIKFGPDGDLYVLEYGGRWFQASPEARLTRIEFEAGNRKPIVVATADKAGGMPPFDVKLSSTGTEDYDRDALKFQWDVTDLGGNTRTFGEANPTVKLDSLGTYIARLTVTDPSGANDSKSIKIVSGNEPPVVEVKIAGNESFYFAGKPFSYAVNVADKEDGSVQDGRIKAEQVALTIDYASADFDLAPFANLTPGDEAAAKFPVAQTLITKGNCKSCHLPDLKLVGPSFAEIAAKYRGDAAAPATLAKKIVSGGSGVWGQVAMPPNAAVNESDAAAILKYVFSLGAKNTQRLPLVGDYAVQLPEGDDGSGSLIVRAAYSDKGEDLAPSLSAQSIKVLRSPTLTVARADKSQGVTAGNFGATVESGAFVGYHNIDLTGIKQIEVGASAMGFAGHKGGDVEIHIESPTGKLIGSKIIAVAPSNFGGAPPQASPDADAPRPEGSATAPPAGGGQRGARGGVGGGRVGGRGGRGRGLGPPPTPIAIEAITGRQNVYVVFKNPNAAAGDTLMSLSSVKFSNIAPTLTP